MRAKWIFPGIVCFIAANLMLCIPCMQKLAVAAKKDRNIVVAFKYPEVIVSVNNNDIQYGLVLQNKGTQGETILLQVIEKPKNWGTSFSSMGTTIGGVFLAGGTQKTVSFNARPKNKNTELTPGTYNFRVRAKTADGVVSRETSLTVNVEKENQAKKILLSSSYPILQGATDTTFEFTLEVTNQIGENALFNLKAKAPQDWQTSFKPVYEDKHISTVNIKEGNSKNVKLEITPSGYASPGKYPVQAKVWQGETEASTTLKVQITGSYDLSCSTPNGLLSSEVKRGSTTTMSVLVQNTGSADQKGISFVSFNPQNWDIEFKPETIKIIKPGESKQVKVLITPPEDALVGDYSVGIKAQGQKASDKLEFRITVKASSVWGWIGVGIIILVIVGLAVTFMVLGRR